METRMLKAANGQNRAAIQEAARLLRAGALVALPTETVYGLGADATNPEAIAALYAVKGRPPQKPLSLLVVGAHALSQYCKAAPEAAYALAGRFWPGPLTLVLWKSERVPAVITAGGDTVGLRCPDHPVTLEILREAGIPVAAPSANLSGEKSPKSAAEVFSGLGGQIAAVVDGGDCDLGVASTLLDLTVTPPKILRQGGLAAEEIKAVIGEVDLL